MLIACLGWGSLVWNPGDLPLGATWFQDGPLLPIEFARKSQDGRISLVLVSSSHPLVRSLWRPMSVSNLTDARRALGTRECPGRDIPESCADYWPRGSRNRFVIGRVGTWARQMQLDAVVWTNLPPKSPNGKTKTPSTSEVLVYLRGLHGPSRLEARRYVSMTPRQIDTPYRKVIEQSLHWHCTSRV